MLPALLVLQAPGTLALNVDATQVGLGVIRVTETMPATPGKRGFYFPKFIPGEHRASGPINGMLDLHFYADGKEIEWSRDPVELFRFVVDVPKGATSVEAKFAVVSEPRAGGRGDTSGSSDNTTPNLARIKWNRLLLYPEGSSTDRIMIQPKLTPPLGWSVASALQPGPVSVTELIDSPAIVGRYYKAYALGTIGGAPVGMDVMAERDGFQSVPDASIDKAKELVRQIGKAYGGRHFRKYRFLVTLSDAGAGAGLEHHESSEDGSGLRAASEDAAGWGELIAHEMNHSWNGKYRRPEGLATPDFHKPMDGSGLWVYEGMTQYMGYVLAARSGFTPKPAWLDNWAGLAQNYQTQPGRTWRPVIDTARSVGLVRGVSGPWAGDRRGTDYYTEGALVWLEADCIIREGSKGTKSLDDFLRRFYGGTTDAPVVKPYSTADVVKDLSAVYPYDWASFFHERIDLVHLNTPAEALEKAGYRIALGGGAGRSRTGVRLPMLGLTVGRDGSITGISVDGPALRAGIAPGARITTVDGKEFSLDDLIAKVSTPGAGTVVLGTASGEATVAYQGGPFVPRLEAIPGRRDWLSEIAKPLP